MFIGEGKKTANTNNMTHVFEEVYVSGSGDVYFPSIF